MNRKLRIQTAVLVGASLSLTALLASQASAADPTTADCLSANEKSTTERNQHHLRAARSELLICAAMSCPTDVRTECARRVDEVNAAIPTIAFEAKDASGNDMSAVKVTLDGQPLTERLEGTAISIDPGEHVFTFEASGLPVLEKKFVIVEGVKERRERITFGNSPAPDAPAPPVGATSSSPMPEADSSAGSSGSMQKTLGWVMAGGGVVGLGLGLVFELKRSSKLDDRDKICPSGVGCPAGSQSRIDGLTDDARSAGTIGTISLIAGGLLVAGGLTLVFTAPSGDAKVAAAPVVAPGFQGIALTGRL
jgi:hypothetical protein